MSARLAVLRVAAPVGAILLGGLCVFGATVLLAFRGFAWTPLAAELAGVGFIAAGVVALVALWRKRTGSTADAERQHQRANAAYLAMGALALGSLLWMVALQTDRWSAPAETISGRLADVDVRHRITKGTYRLRLEIEGAAEPLTWSCWRWVCDGYGPLLALDNASGRRVEAQALGDRLIALRIDGRDYLDPIVERARLVRQNREVVILLAVGLAILALVAVLWIRRRPGAYVGPDPHAAARAGDAIRRALGPRRRA